MERWVLKNTKIDTDQIAHKHHMSKLISQILVNRDITADELIDKFIHPTIDNLRDAKVMKDVVKTVELLKQKISLGKKIRIIGDYDVDGIISTYVLYSALKYCGAKVDYEIPDRIKDGYGVSEPLIDRAVQDEIDTIMTCDNGIAATVPLGYAKSMGMSVIVTDHHNIPFTEDEAGNRTPQIPDVDAVVNPKQEDCMYAFKELCGAGVAFKLVQVLYEEMGIEPSKAIEFIEFVAIAAVCDVVDLVDENRIIVKLGLEKINQTTNKGLRALIEAAELTDTTITAYHLGYVLGPTLNATGRLDTANEAIVLLTTEDDDVAKAYAKKFIDLNNERKEMTVQGTQDAIEMIEKTRTPEDKVLVVYMPRIHESLAGIIAGRIKEKYYMPTIVLTDVHDGVKGSGRSIEQYDMFEELSKCKDLLNKFGGHPMAAGLSLDKENIENLRERLNAQTTLTSKDLIPKLTLDMRLDLERVDYRLMDDLLQLEPHGKGNHKPIFGEKNIKVVTAAILGKNKNVLRIKLLSPKGKYFTGVYFGEVQNFEKIVTARYGSEELQRLYKGDYVKIHLDIAFELSLNEYMGNTSIQLIIKAFR
ncbi:MAG: single-stranded-DNA-specific exonuclease RecJ [Cellulosilyticaceae bacterium]